MVVIRRYGRLWIEKDSLVVLIVGVSEDVGALQALRGEAEDVVDDEDGAFGVGGACGVCAEERRSVDERSKGWKWNDERVWRTAFRAIKVDVFALLFVAF